MSHINMKRLIWLSQKLRKQTITTYQSLERYRCRNSLRTINCRVREKPCDPINMFKFLLSRILSQSQPSLIPKDIVTNSIEKRLKRSRLRRSKVTISHRTHHPGTLKLKKHLIRMNLKTRAKSSSKFPMINCINKIKNNLSKLQINK